ncbi:hypothetical protein [Microscilla marina]|uniref:HTH cro/C1-type domain-containing protein n=1 Tax=Microscilla marina ATCC 23134 TaxID=313606 RepID=A1ZZT5_MICM2|nr:hypothetical protein [Microscilla marina]EAY24096.1 hypothetical protein M23134_02472 [Microscilla marina ATCC 23134]
MTIEELKKFFEERPALSVRGVNDDAGLSDNYLNKILRNNQKISKKTIDKLDPILRKYGYQCNKNTPK